MYKDEKMKRKMKTRQEDETHRSAQIGIPHDPVSFFSYMGWIVGFEPTASRATIWRANQLRHTHHIAKFCGAPEGTRTPDLLLRRQLLYPVELLAQK